MNPSDHTIQKIKIKSGTFAGGVSFRIISNLYRNINKKADFGEPEGTPADRG